MNLSSRKKLLSEADNTLNHLRESLKYSKGKMNEETPTTITPNDILQFLTSVFVDNKSNRRKIFNQYNRVIKELFKLQQQKKKQIKAGNYNHGIITGFGEDYFDEPGYSIENFLLSSPDELITTPKLSSDRTTVDILYSRPNRGKIYKAALNSAIFDAIVEPYYPELKSLIWLAHPSNRYRAGEIPIASKFVLKTLKSKMTVSGKNWKPVFDKYNK